MGALAAGSMAGVAGPAAELPHRDAIQRLFGEHDVSTVEAHIGGAAAGAAGALGARAYATGEKVAFASSPDLHTAAHEAAHVIQQRAAGTTGAAALGGGALTSPGDPAEQHADAVADLVIRGESAAALLASPPPLTASVARETPDKKPDPAAAFPLQASYYFSENVDAFLLAIRSHLGALSLPTGHDRLRWTATSAIVASRATEHIRALADDRRSFSQLPGLLAPLDPWHLVDAHRPIVPSTANAARPEGSLAWSPAAGTAIAHAVEATLRSSMARMGPRYVAQVDQTNGDVARDVLVASHPFDRVTARLLADDRLVAVGKSNGRAQPTGVFAGGLRVIAHFEWQGARDPRLWNWLRVIDPPDATAEEVSMALFDARSEGDEPATQFAYGITAAPPFFGIPPAWARTFRDAARLAPAKGHDGEDGASAHALALAGSSLADTAALAQVSGSGSAPTSKNRGELLTAIDRGQRQIDLVGERLAPWKAIATRLAPAREWLARRAAAMAGADRDEVARWAPVVTGQQAILFDASGEMVEILDLAASSGANGPDAPGQAPFRDVLAAYATAVGESHLIDSARAALAGARARRAQLPIVLARATVREGSAAASELADATGAAPGSEGALALEHQQQIERAQLSIEARALHGQPADADELDAVTLGAAEHAFRTRLTVLRRRLGELDHMLQAVDRSVVQAATNTLVGEVHQLRRTIAGIHIEIGRIDGTLAQAGMGEATAFDGNAQHRERWLRQTRREALTAAEQRLAHLAEREQFERLGKRVRDEVGDAQMRAAIAEILFLIGTSALSAGLAGALAGAARGAMLARTTGSATRLLGAAPRIRLASGAIEFGTEAALNAAFQTLGTGSDMGSTFLENLLSDAATLAALAPLRRLLGRVGTADETVAGLWQRAGRAGKVVLGKGAVVSAEMITAAAASYAAHMAIHGRPDTPETITGWLVQGASMAAGRFVAGRMTDLVDRQGHFAERGAFLRQRAALQRQRAEEVVKTGDEHKALELLEAQKQLLDEETALLRTLEHDSAAREQAKLSPHQLALLRQANTEAQAHLAGPAYHELPFRLAGLDEVVPGARWSGDPDQIAAALDHARRAGVPVAVVRRDLVTGRWDIRLGDRPVVLDERVPGARRLSPRMAMVADELGGLLDRDPDGFVTRYQQLAATLKPAELAALKDSIRKRGRVSPPKSAALNQKQLIELHRRRVIALREIGEFERMTFHGTGSSMLDGLTRTDGQLLPAAELNRRGLTPTTGEGSKFTPVDGHKEFTSVGEGEPGFGTALAYADASRNLSHYNPRLLSDVELQSHMDRLEYIVANFDSVKLEVEGDFRLLAAREKGHFAAELEKLKRETKRRKDLPPNSPVRQGGHRSADNHPLLFEFDMAGSKVRRDRRPLVGEGGALGGEGSVHGPIDLKRLIRRVYVPAEHVQATEQKLRAILGHGDFEVIAMEAVDGLPGPGVLGSSRVSTYKLLGQLEKDMEAVDRAHEAAIREVRPLDIEVLSRELTR